MTIRKLLMEAADWIGDHTGHERCLHCGHSFLWKASVEIQLSEEGATAEAFCTNCFSALEVLTAYVLVSRYVRFHPSIFGLDTKRYSRKVVLQGIAFMKQKCKQAPPGWYLDPPRKMFRA